MSGSLHLNVPVRPVYKVHPVVVFSILDHYRRRTDEQKRVVGALLGEKTTQNEVVITNSFPVPHSEREDSVTLDMEYFNTALDLHKRVNPKEVIVGWYSTGTEISYASSLVHQIFKEKLPNPVLLTIDVAMKNARMGVKAYRGKQFGIGDKGVIYRFEDAELELEAYEAEKIGVDALINSVPDDEKLDAPATILSDFDNLELALNNLLTSLEIVSEYVHKVTEKKIPGDENIGRAIAHALSAIPTMDAETFERIFNSNVQDLLMIMYLSNLARLQLSLADRIQAVS